MAIIKTRSTGYGVTADYNKIQRVEVDGDSKQVHIDVALFVNKEARDNNMTPLLIDRITIPFNNLATNPLATFYKMLEDYNRGPVYGGTGDSDPGTVPQFEVLNPPTATMMPPPPVATNF
jgi:hypothetical protein